MLTNYLSIIIKMKNGILSLIVTLLVCFSSVQAFVPSTSSSIQSRSISQISQNSIRPGQSVKVNFFGGPKDDGSPGDYICKDCGYVFTKGPKAWAALDKDKYQCPPCGAPKFRFKKVPKGSASGKVEVKKSWF